MRKVIMVDCGDFHSAALTGDLTLNRNEDIENESELLSGIFTFFVILHLGCLVLGLFHAICGQYFYLPFICQLNK